jgi:hypothetical protein
MMRSQRRVHDEASVPSKDVERTQTFRPCVRRGRVSRVPLGMASFKGDGECCA